MIPNTVENASKITWLLTFGPDEEPGTHNYLFFLLLFSFPSQSTFSSIFALSSPPNRSSLVLVLAKRSPKAMSINLTIGVLKKGTAIDAAYHHGGVARHPRLQLAFHEPGYLCLLPDCWQTTVMLLYQAHECSLTAV